MGKIKVKTFKALKILAKGGVGKIKFKKSQYIFVAF